MPRPVAAALLVALLAVPAAAQQSGSRSPGPTTSTPSCTIEGRVVQTEGMVGIERAFIRLMQNGAPFYQSLTQARGAFRFLGLPLGMFELEVEADGYLVARERVDLSFNCRAISITIYLERDPDARPATSTAPPVAARVLQIPGKAKTEFERGFTELNKKDRPERSLPFFQRALEIYPDYDEAYVQLALAHLRLEQPQDAQRVLDTAVGVYPSNARAHTLLGVLYNQQGRNDDARREFETAVAADDADWRAHFELGRMFLRARQGAAARAHAQRAHKLNPQEADVHLLFHDACLLQGDDAAALAETDEFIKLFPRDELVPRLREHAANLRKSLAARTQ